MFFSDPIAQGVAMLLLGVAMLSVFSIALFILTKKMPSIVATQTSDHADVAFPSPPPAHVADEQARVAAITAAVRYHRARFR